jgi:hypothetical protein
VLDRDVARRQAGRPGQGRALVELQPAARPPRPVARGDRRSVARRGRVSFVGQRDPRVRTIVAWDNLRSSDSGGIPGCAKAPDTRKPVPPRVPALGLAGDYPLFGRPKTEEPPRNEKQGGFDAIRKQGLDAGEIVIRGGGHFEYAYIPNPAFQATARGMDLVAWYTTAWMDRYVKGDPSAGARLATDRWRDDEPEKAIDPTDANLFSTYYDSPIVTGDFACGDLRKCAGVRPDGLPKPYSFLADTTSKDAPRGAGQPAGTVAPAGSTGAPPAASGTATARAPARAATRSPRGRGSAARRAAASAASPPTAAAVRARAGWRTCRSRSRAPSGAAAASCAPTARSAPRAAACARATCRRAARPRGRCARVAGCHAAPTSCSRAASTPRATSSARTAGGTSARCASADGAPRHHAAGERDRGGGRRHRRGVLRDRRGDRARPRGIGDFAVLESGDGVGGAWHWNTYPGVAVDIPSFSYQFSYAQQPDWSRVYAPGRELKAYAEHCVDRFGLRSRIRLSTTVTGATWDDDEHRWHLETAEARASAPGT